jgi:cytochrome P450
MTDIFASHDKNIEAFVKSDIQDLGFPDGGISWERDPIKHRGVAKRLAPAFSSKNIKTKEGIVHHYVDLFIEKMKLIGTGAQGADMAKWTAWLAMDMSADMAYGRELHQMRDMKSAHLLEATYAVNLFATVYQVLRRFPLLSPIKFLFLSPSVVLSLPRLLRTNDEEVQSRIDRQGKTAHLDYFEQLVPADEPRPTDPEKIAHYGVIAGQLLIAGFEPVMILLYSTLFFLLTNPSDENYKWLVSEIRDLHSMYEDITADAVSKQQYLTACLQESLRLHSPGPNGLPRVSPGANVDGHYVPKGIVCQHAYFSAARDSRYFHEPRAYRPQRWLSPDHKLFEQAYADDCHAAVAPFNQGPRACPGKEAALAQARVFITKLLWTFDLELAAGQNLSFDKDFSVYGFWITPEMWIKFKPVVRT